MAIHEKIVENTTGSPIELLTVGKTLPALSDTEIEVDEYRKWARDETILEIQPYLISGDIIVKDGIDSLNATDGEAYLKYPHFAESQRFQLPTLPGSKQFTQKTTQTAVEESFPTICLSGVPLLGTTRNIDFINGTVTQIGTDTVEVNLSGLPSQGRTYLLSFYNNGNTANKWLFHVPTSDATDDLPYFAHWDLEVFGILFSNKISAIDCDIEFYVNGINNPALVYTLEVRGYKAYWTTTATSLFQMSIGDTLHIFVKKVGNNTPNSVQIEMNFRIRTNIVGSSGVVN